MVEADEARYDGSLKTDFLPAALAVSGLCFSYPENTCRVLDGASFQVPAGAFCLLVGATGSGKSTLLRLMKPEIAPSGTRTGSIEIFGRDPYGLTSEESATDIGFVFQDPENQIVCDTVLHEMAFGLENLAVGEQEMHRRIAETSYFLGMGSWFHTRTADLSGGQRQLLALASTLVMRPRLLLLDEPTSMLDPVAEQAFLGALFRINRELGVSVIVATHRPEAMCDYATCAFELNRGRISPVAIEVFSTSPKKQELYKPSGSVTPQPQVSQTSSDHSAQKLPVGGQETVAARKVSYHQVTGKPAIMVAGAWLRYERKAPWVLRGLDLEISTGEIRAFVGSNGCGKSSLLALIAGALGPQHGRLRNTLAGSQCLLPQHPDVVFSCETVEAELMEWADTAGYGRDEALTLAGELALFRPADTECDTFATSGKATSGEAACERKASPELLKRNPLDLSGGQRQQLALAKLLLVRPRLLLLDEPTKGVDRQGRAAMAQALKAARASGATIVMATHDTQFACSLADTVSLLFDGEVTLTQPCEDFFRDSWVWRA